MKLHCKLWFKWRAGDYGNPPVLLGLSFRPNPFSEREALIPDVDCGGDAKGDEKVIQWTNGPRMMCKFLLQLATGQLQDRAMGGSEVEAFAGAVGKRKPPNWLWKVCSQFEQPGKCGSDILFTHKYLPATHQYEVKIAPAIDQVEVAAYFLKEKPLHWYKAKPERATHDQMVTMAQLCQTSECLNIKVGKEIYLLKPEAIKKIIMEVTSMSDQDKAQLYQKLLKKIYRGSTNITLRVSASEAEDILEAFEEGRLAGTGIADIELLSDAPPPFFSRLMEAKGIPIPADDDRSPALLGFVRGQIRKQAIIDSLTDLPALLFPKIGTTTAREIMNYSQKVFFSALKEPSERTWLKFDLLKGLLCWNILTAYLLLMLSPLWSKSDPTVWTAALFTGMLLSICGSLVCSSVISFLGCAAGGIVMTLAFGSAHGLLIANLGLDGPNGILDFVGNTDAFTRIVGGLIGTMAAHPHFGSLGYPTILMMLFTTGCAIGVTADLMAAPRRIAQTEVPNRGQPLRGGFYGAFFGGSFIGIIFGLNAAFHLFLRDALAFSASFLLVGTIVFGVTVWWRTDKNRSKAFTFAALYAVFVGMLLLMTFAYPSTRLSLVTNSMLTGIFHATFYTVSFLIGEYFGGLRAAVWAAVLEGVIGYLTFVCARAAQSPWWVQTFPPWPMWGFLGLVVSLMIIAAGAYAVALRDGKK
jgi:hypothetical protein